MLSLPENLDRYVKKMLFEMFSLHEKIFQKLDREEKNRCKLGYNIAKRTP